MNLKKVATSLTIGSAVPLCFTGICLLLRIRWGLIDPIHEISSLFFLVGMILHTWVHRKIIINYLRQPMGRWLLIFFSLLCAIALMSVLTGKEHRIQDHHWQRNTETKAE